MEETSRSKQFVRQGEGITGQVCASFSLFCCARIPIHRLV